MPPLPVDRAIDRSQTPDDQDLPEVPCLFCGEPTKHMNDGGDSWLVNALVNGEHVEFLYHNKCCDDRVWRCGCVTDYVENVGTHCAACKRPREQAKMFPGTCANCHRSAMISDAKGIHITILCKCKGT